MKHLRITLMAGLMLFLLSAAALCVFFIFGKSSQREARQHESFGQILKEYDASLSGKYLNEYEIESLHLELNKLEERAVALESWLSILKRRRFLASIHQPSLKQYRNSIEKALKKYPGSSAVMAVSAASLIKDSPIDRRTDELLRKMLPLITDDDFNNLRLSIHIILGDLNDPEKALNLPSDIYSDGTEEITVDLTILKILRGEYRDASSDVHSLLNNSPSVPSMRFAAEFHYDFGDLSRSAEIFSYINDEQSLVRQADALYLAGYKDAARLRWNILADLQNETGIYNLALSANTPEETQNLLEKLISIEPVLNSESRQYGLIQYSRYLDNQSAVSFLRSRAGFSVQNYPYIDLEIARRFADGRDPGQRIAQTWMLLDRHSDNEELHKWAAWNFLYQRNFSEAKILMDRLNIIKASAFWIDIFKALIIMNDGFLNEAYKLLDSIPEQNADWYVYANLGFILETIASFEPALDQYDMAAVKILESYNAAHLSKIAGRIYVRIAKCLREVNRFQEEKRALQKALEYDPDNLTAKRELEKLF